MRGISALGVCLVHEVFFFHDINNLMKKTKGFAAFLFYIVGGPFLLFANWRPIFALISGITNSYFNHQKEYKIKKMIQDLILKTFLAILLTVIFYSFKLITTGCYRGAKSIKNHSI